MTVLAIALAIIDATCFAAAAVVQQRAVRHTVHRHAGTDDGEDLHPRHHRLNLRGLLSLPRQPGWLAGAGLMVVGVLLHVVALVLAPVSVIQPIGVLGVPIAVYLAARLDHHPPAAGARLPIAACVVGVAVFVWLAATHASGRHAVELPDLLRLEAVLLAFAALCAIVAHYVHGWSRCVLNAIGGAAAVGSVAALARATVQHLQAGHGLLEGSTLAMVGLLALNGLVGAWLVQQAYASGRAEVVLACLTVVDPMVAVLIGLMALGEGADLSTPAMVAMAACAVPAVVGVVALARSRPGIGRPEPTVPTGRGTDAKETL
ncbi:hypothetical protein [Georgenia alba]|uniref:Magnesium transporter NIPA n=1 Tax=Georgenia alba TaxID=2233858 RepID=A0ABW2QA15_9MICO